MIGETMKAAYRVEAFNEAGEKIAEETSELGGPIEIEDVVVDAVTYGIHTYRISVIEVETNTVHIVEDE